ncbi:Crp/Fnr family transcriptional regulator (plasmid) [Burkholderia sp. JP2-270]|uniref:Crp/Fnr family transcriptional regulator n=1 Tax=Burkholderia sp. JP2-270 TaxID=2217913 RepID=UPI000DA3B456|nr:Crp/Fnr family transcriptional regulator [Burkholderia sp. JP2-270]AWV05489.1 Crp/Fnr family transcriptional regulator [Burkholderia sp. JP2-270]
MENKLRPEENHLLGAFPQAELARFARHLVRVELPLGRVVCESGNHLNHVYFPTTSIVSLLYLTQDGASTEIAVVGNDGLIGIPIFMGGETTPGRCVVQNAGQAYRLEARILKDEFDRAGAIQQLLLRYTQALIAQIAQTAVCNRHHSIDQQLCRWLLHSIDRLPSNQLKMTQDLIANMLGVRRASVTQAAKKLQDAGLVRYSYGHIEVLDRPGLETRACECYGVVKREFDRLLPGRDSDIGDSARDTMTPRDRTVSPRASSSLRFAGGA